MTELNAAIGKALFDRAWVPAPSSAKSNDGLGPFFNARSCVQCHSAASAGRMDVDADGRLADRGAVVRLAGPRGVSDATYGAQIQTRAVQGLSTEATVHVDWQMTHDTLDDGSRVELRAPNVRMSNMEFGGLSSNVMATLILAPSLGVAAHIAAVDVAALEIVDDGATSGRLSRGANGDVLVMGRKATEPDLAAFTALAFMRDLGLATPTHAMPAGDCTEKQPACRAAPHGADVRGVEIGNDIIAPVVAYLKTISVASPTDGNHVIGRELFTTVGCAACHTATLPGRDGQRVTLYSDLRLHDLGLPLSGFEEASGQSAGEWRTAPLIGVAQRLKAGSTLLHDGRARTVPEAILWHHGSADSARIQYKRLSVTERTALEDYVLSR